MMRRIESTHAKSFRASALRAARRFPVAALAALLAALFLSALTAGCKGEAETVRALVIYAAEDAVLQRGAEELPVTTGLELKKHDVIRTIQGPVDIQTSSGATVRVRPFSELALSSLMSEAPGGTELQLRSGGLTARLRKQANNESFQVTTPTAIAGVRGTTFTVDEDPTAGARVTVLEGKVALRPRSEQLEARKAEGELPDNGLADIDASMLAAEVVVEDGQSASLAPQAVAAIQKLDADLAKAREEQTELPPAAIDEIRAGMGAASEELTVRQPAEIGLREQAEMASLVEVDADAFTAALESNAGAGGDATEAAQRVAESYAERRDAAVDQIEARVQAAGANQNIEAMYELIEVVNLKDGEVIRGAVMTQAGDMLIVHSNEGVRRVPVQMILHIDFVAP